MADSFCGAARRHFSDRLDGQPIGWLAAIFSGLHLRICPQCRRVQRSLVGTRDALAALRDHDPEAGVSGPDRG